VTRTDRRRGKEMYQRSQHWPHKQLITQTALTQIQNVMD